MEFHNIPKPAVSFFQVVTDNMWCQVNLLIQREVEMK